MPLWLRKYLPYLSALATALGLIAPLSAPALALALALAGAHLSERTSAGFETVAKLADDIKVESRDKDGTDLLLRAAGRGAVQNAEVGADFRMLRSALIELDRSQAWGGLSPVKRPEDQRIVYLCREHLHAMDYPYNA